MTNSLLQHCLRLVPTDEVIRHVEQICRYDRYQGSTGLEQAAQLVAEAATAAGLTDVRIDRFPADGTAQWWSWRAPVSWTPVAAVLDVYDGPDRVIRIDHAEQPFSVATYSAPTSAGGCDAGLVRVGPSTDGLELKGALAVVERSCFGRAHLLEELSAAGAVGFVTDAPWKGTPDAVHTGRIELPPDSILSAFSVTPAQLDRIATAADHGGRARMTVEVDRSAAMPVVSGVLPGTDASAGEIWLTGHLCHPRPGANDNASGVAALLGVAAALSAGRRAVAGFGTRGSIRFFWGPEFLGQAAVLHQYVGSGGRGRLPDAVINLDMVGEDQDRCASPFVVERPLDLSPSLLGPLAEHYVAGVFAATADHPGSWQPSPFLGFSDHALYADPGIDRPAVQFCHPADRFNHSAGDAPDKVSPVEMLRSTAAAAALAQTLAGGGPDEAEVRRIVDRWCERERTRGRAVASGHGSPWAQRYLTRVEAGCDLLTALAAGDTERPAAPPSPSANGPAIARDWSGPLNLRAMMADLSPGTRGGLAELIAADKHCLSMLFHFAVRANGRRTRHEIVDDASLALEREIEPAVSGRLFDALLESGWVRAVGA
ncbi:M28 family peptidase [Streptacidiphilus sp. P02-A3a]|uniref:M28 family peptidase n=1 Tax=Streptacidiphilus sp. P02-A3a TaxID=2704468 RepID=UPI0015F9E653|nr:M28 family peptidase [Streptacidiphilus sp. P02-A3a]QMU71837.1 M28 family peptidase [Streptacidiphilus sp. P02-A3a]